MLENPLLYDSGNTGVDSASIAQRGQIAITSFLPNKIEAQVSFQQDGEFTLLQYFYPGWKVKIDGEEIDAFKKEAIFLAVKVPKGEHQVVFEFYPPHFKGYLFLSGGVFILILIYLSTLSLRSLIKIKPPHSGDGF
ncbi:MAG: putative membrane protein YfhO [Saprospiraceae bacterium]